MAFSMLHSLKNLVRQVENHFSHLVAVTFVETVYTYPFLWHTLFDENTIMM